MLFNAAHYIFLFLPVTVVGYFALNKYASATISRAWLVLASLFFYGYWNTAYLILIVGSMLFNFYIGKRLQQPRINNHQYTRAVKKIIFLIGLSANIGVLAYYKYSDFVIANLNVILETDIALLDLLLPLAISFFTFQQVAYLVDCYKSDAHEYEFLNYALFVTFFPQLIAGPIVHHKEMMPQFSNNKNNRLCRENIAKGVYIFSIGLFKKVAIADTFSVWATTGFDALALEGASSLSVSEAWLTSLSYTFQLYYDFSAYSDMAIGAALMFNIYLPINFNSPYKALNIQDFWRRWHMTLSRWLKDYVYIPLGGNRQGNYLTSQNLLLTFIIGGLWHGAAWTFLLWGVLHGSAVIIHRYWQQTGIKLPLALSWLLTFLFVNFAWVFFRADSINSAVGLIEKMLGLNVSNFGLGLLTTNAVLFVAVFGLLTLVSKNSMQIGLNKSRYGFKESVLVSVSLFLSIVLGISSGSAEFLYFNF